MPYYDFDCKICGRHTENVYRSNTQKPPIYCSIECRDKAPKPRNKPNWNKGLELSPRIVTHCLQCGKEIRVLECRIKSGRGRFCSKACSTKYTFRGFKHKPRTIEHRKKLGAYHIGKVPPNKKPYKELVCEICGSVFEVPQRRIGEAKYCSRQCSHEAKRLVTGINHPLWVSEQRKCEWCGKVVWVKPCKFKEFRYCSRQCQGASTAAKLANQKGPTSIEKLLMTELDKSGIKYKAQYRIANWLVDIAIPNHRIAIEADGDYWHSSAKQQEKDRNKDHWLQAHKWTMLRFPESQIRVSPSNCVKTIISHINQG